MPLPNGLEYDFVVVADGGYDKAKDQLSKIHLMVGDFDSTKNLPTHIETKGFPPEKDYTDGEIALLECSNKGCDQVDIFYGLGGRIDHFLGNLTLLKRAKALGITAKLVGASEDIYYSNDSFSISTEIGTTISLLPFSRELHIISSKGLKYPTNNLTLLNSEAKGVSNVATSNLVEIEFGGGDCLVIINK